MHEYEFKPRIWSEDPCGGGDFMPRYDFLCLSCKKQFSEALMLSEYEEDEVICPHCGGDNVERSWVRSTPSLQERVPER